MFLEFQNVIWPSEKIKSFICKTTFLHKKFSTLILKFNFKIYKIRWPMFLEFQNVIWPSEKIK